jgi:hypothetical protein
MAWRYKGRSPAEPLDYEDPHSLAAHVGRHLAWLEARGYARDGLWTRRADIKEFLAWCTERGVVYPEDLNRTVVDLYQRHLSHRPKRDGDLLSLHTQGKKLMTIANTASGWSESDSSRSTPLLNSNSRGPAFGCPRPC